MHFLQSCMGLFQICRSLRLSPSCLPTCSSVVDRHAFSYLHPRIFHSVGVFLILKLHVLLALGVFTICLESEEHLGQSEFGQQKRIQVEMTVFSASWINSVLFCNRGQYHVHSLR